MIFAVFLFNVDAFDDGTTWWWVNFLSGAMTRAAPTQMQPPCALILAETVLCSPSTSLHARVFSELN